MSQMESNNKQDITYIKLKKEDGQQFINSIKENLKNTQIVNPKFKILHENDYILYPIVEDQDILRKARRYYRKTN